MNSGPPVPQTGALTGLRYAPKPIRGGLPRHFGQALQPRRAAKRDQESRNGVKRSEQLPAPGPRMSLGRYRFCTRSRNSSPRTSGVNTRSGSRPDRCGPQGPASTISGGRAVKRISDYSAQPRPEAVVRIPGLRSVMRCGRWSLSQHNGRALEFVTPDRERGSRPTGRIGNNDLP